MPKSGTQTPMPLPTTKLPEVGRHALWRVASPHDASLLQPVSGQ